jgi:nicotinate-nucleotide pyrophosphorylase (carboxylating)
MSVFPYDRSAVLASNEPRYAEEMSRFIGAAYDADMTGGDLTTESLGLSDDLVNAVITAKQAGRFCGVIELKWFLSANASNVEVLYVHEDGGLFEIGDEVVKLKGAPSDLLRIERVLLNVLQRMCGIATMTAQYVEKAAECGVAATRKTLYGLLDKRAVSVGGGLTHRLNLSDAPMYKDTHFNLVDHQWSRILKGLNGLPDDLPFVTIEVRRHDGLAALVAQLPKDAPWPIVLLLDNFTPDELKEAIEACEKPENVYFEASGGVTLDTIEAYAKTGVDVVSVGALTHTVSPIDLSMTIS